MPADLDELFIALGRHVDAIPLPPAEAARRRGHERGRNQAVVAVAVAVLVVVTGAAGLLNKAGAHPDQTVAPRPSSRAMADVGSPISLGGTTTVADSVAADGRVFTSWQTADGTTHILAVDLHTAARLWEAQRPGKPDALVSLRARTPAVVLTTEQAVYAYRPTDGRLLWDLPVAEEDSLVLHDRFLVRWSAQSRRIEAFDWQSGQRRWSRAAPVEGQAWISPVRVEGELGWDGRSDDRMLQIAANGLIRVVRADTGEVLRTLTVPALEPSGMIQAYQDWLITQDAPNRVVATDLRGGEPAVVFTAAARHTVIEMDMCGADRVCLLEQSPDGQSTLVAVDLTERRVRWQVPTLGNYPMVGSNGRDRMFVVGDATTVLYDANGREIMRSPGIRTSWLTADTLLKIPAAPGAVELIRAADGQVTTLGDVPLQLGVCADTVDRLACPTPGGLRIWSLTG